MSRTRGRLHCRSQTRSLNTGPINAQTHVASALGVTTNRSLERLKAWTSWETVELDGEQRSGVIFVHEMCVIVDTAYGNPSQD